MKIVVLDGYTLQQHDLSWVKLQTLGDVIVYDRTASEEIITRAQDADIILTNKTPLTAETLEQLPNLRYIGVLATGYNIVDVETARKRGIPVTNVPTYGTNSVAQFVFALILELVQQVGIHASSVASGEWAACPDFSFTRTPLMELAGKTIGLIGLGKIGHQTAVIARAFGMNVIAAGSGRRSPTPVKGIEWVDLPQLLTRADVVSLHCPLTPDTFQLINKDRLKLMKSSSYLINTSRGQIIAEQDLADALHNGKLAGAALDVLSIEPPPQDHPLLHAPNCIITPHIAWASKEARERLMDTAVENVRQFQAGALIHVVNL
ncbi:D-isomer specific 2-hydroxyacid dehydrogenase NAD-binding protein [Paenibacillus mucilaginosus 3016]|uniref:D-isomer specific 2-hydroxyacid dehydrogenase NAD-binding protein n=1 Tax=Paenibacillus mucilaginosus 3016 TaxID=1116391 RepID=H6NCS4_9BACL|nr:D-2-hydroxyacid dehydrogenase [Paenibacillus mucilaginosus]AFC29003.1 D-isomer specific 2-hydroxyacid dehydrogenase NAD-binding protein [Paenibacillus mucilaginosus 3016]WFA17749.1 D-2-hydroxyacid dehydrogenase [Paenibacillus mucilaginosus]